MAIPPSLKDHRFGEVSAPHCLELYLDYACPFSKKEFITIYDGVLGKLPSNISVLFRQVPQPWHPSSTYLHEAALAVSKLSQDPLHFMRFSRALFEDAEQFYDDKTYTRGRKEIHEQLAQMAHASLGIDPAKFLKQLEITQEGNAGNQVTPLLKLVVKYHRQTGVHVTPTVAFDGLIDPTPSSSWTPHEWLDYLNEKSKSG